MLVFKRLFKFYLDASIHVALAVLALYWTSVYLLNILPNYILAGFLFFSTIGYYNLVKYGGHLKVPDGFDRTSFIMIRTLTVISFFLTIIFSVLLPLRLYAVLGVMFVLGALYFIPLFPNKKSLRSWGLIKILIVGLVWTGSTSVLPIMDRELPWHPDFIFLGLQRFLLVLVLMIPFEIRDLKKDPASLHTLPQKFGLVPTRWIGYLMILFWFPLTFMRLYFTEVEVWTRLGLSLILFASIHYAKKSQSRYYANFWVESIPLLFWAALWWAYFGSVDGMI